MQEFQRLANEMVRQMSQDPSTKDLLKTKEKRLDILQEEVNTEKGKEQIECMMEMMRHGLLEGEIVELPTALLDQWLEAYGDEHYTEGEDLNDLEGDLEEVEVQDDMKHNAGMLMFRKEYFRKFLKFMYIHFGIMISPDALTGNWFLKDDWYNERRKVSDDDIELPLFEESVESLGDRSQSDIESTESLEDGSQSDEKSTVSFEDESQSDVGSTESFEDGKLPSSEIDVENTVDSEDNKKWPLTLKICSFSPTHMTGGCASLDRADGLLGTDGHGMFPPDGVCSRHKRLKMEGAYVEVARDRLEIENPQKVSWQNVNLNWAQLKKDWLGLFHQVLPFLSSDRILFQYVQMMNIASAKACELFIPFLKKVLAEHGIQVERISLEYADKAITEYDDVHTVFNSPEVITEHFDGVPSMEDYHAGHYSLSTNLTPKEYAIACDNHVEHMMHYHAEDCGATCREELVKWIGNEGMRQFFAVSGNAPNAMTRKQQKDIAGRRNETMAMNRARYGAQKQSNLEPVRSVVRQRKFGQPKKKKCPVLVDGEPCGGYIVSGGKCPRHGGGKRPTK